VSYGCNLSLIFGRLFFSVILALCAVIACPVGGLALEIQRVVSPGGIEAWLVEEHSIPIIALSFVIPRGSYHDPEGKEGLSYLLSTTLDEGAGDLDSQAFRNEIDNRAIRITFESSLDQFSGKLETLREFHGEAFNLLAISMTKPRFDEEPVQRMKNAILTKIKRETANPGRIAELQLFKAAYGATRYGRPANGTSETMSLLTSEDLRVFFQDHMALEGMKFGVVGDISASELEILLDRTFGNLKKNSSFADVAEIELIEGPRAVMVELDIPQTEIRFAMKGLLRSDPDFIPAYVMNYVLGGGGFNSRLYDEVREKRGLSYSVYSHLYPFQGTGVIVGGAATRSNRSGITLNVITDVIAEMAANGPSEVELSAAKRYLTGAYPLRFDSNSKIADQLVAIQFSDLGVDYINRRNSFINAVSIDDVRRVAARLLKPENMIVIVVGKKNLIRVDD
jgi:zinc protease